MGGGNPEKGSSNKPSSSHHRKPQPDNNPQKPSPPSKPKPKPKPKPEPKPKPKPEPKPKPPPSNPNPIPSPRPPPPPPPPAYGFHMLDRRTIVLADGTARSYFALPPDYQDFPPIRPHAPIPSADDHYRQQNQDYWNSLGLDPSRKRKFGGDDDEFARQRQQLLHYGNSNGSHIAGPSTRPAKHMKPQGDNRTLHNEIDQAKVKTSFLNFIRLLNENANQKKKYLADGKQGSLQCLACARSLKDFPDVHSLIMHTYNPENSTSDQVFEHLGLHKALCILMGWNYLMPPDNSKVYQQLSAEEIAADRDDLIMWPPHVIIRNTNTGKGRDGRMEGLGNKAMDMKLRDFGFTTGKPKSMYGREGHMVTTVVKFAGDQSGLKDAMRLADFFEKEKHGRGSWIAVQPMFRPGSDDEKDPSFVKLDKKTGEKERVLYGYLGTVFDLEVLDFDTKKKVTIESKREKSHHT